jgi:PPK2 family polyphosphate:nucleotide phosphotransferase
MRLKPLAPGSAPDLTDAAAKPPEDLPEKDVLRDQLDRLADRTAKLQTALFAESTRALLVVLQGRDAAGKDGVVRHLFGRLNPMGLELTSFKVPTPVELSHDYLWRVHKAVPARGRIGIFNRSHYEDVLVVRVHGLVPPAVWGARYEQINAFERHLTENGVTILKFCLHVSREEQRKRLLERLDDPEKNWKFNAADLRERDRWGDYTEAYRDALARTNTRWAPWYVVPADRKTGRDLLIAEVVLETLERLKPVYPPVPQEVAQLKKLLTK